MVNFQESVAATALFQAEIVPSSVAKMKRAGLQPTTKFEVLLKTMPVGAADLRRRRAGGWSR